MIQFNKNNMTVFQSELYMTTTAVIEAEDVVIMTDPNWLPDEIEEIRNFIRKVIGDRQLYIIYTHSDFDHVIGAGAFPEAKVIASKQFANQPDKEAVIEEIHRFDQQYYLHRDYQHAYPSVDIIIENDGQKLELGSFTLTFYHAPGHTSDSLFSVVEPYGIFLSGDYLSDVEFPFISSSYRDYVHTMDKAESILRNHRITTQIPGHGTITQSQEEMKNRLDSSKYYLNQLFDDNGELESYLSKAYTFFAGMKSIHLENKKMAKQANDE